LVSNDTKKLKSNCENLFGIEIQSQSEAGFSDDVQGLISVKSQKFWAKRTLSCIVFLLVESLVILIDTIGVIATSKGILWLNVLFILMALCVLILCVKALLISEYKRRTLMVSAFFLISIYLVIKHSKCDDFAFYFLKKDAITASAILTII
jgi:hypothetical protein